MSKREFRLEYEHTYNRSSPGRWIASHAARYWYLPLAIVAAAVINNFFYSYVQVYVGRGFSVITTPGWTMTDLLPVVQLTAAVVAGQGAFGLLRNYAAELLAQLVERNARDELYISLLGKDQTFHSRQRVGDIMARATNDVRELNFMVNPGWMLIVDASFGIVVPLVVISTINTELLLVPSIFVAFLIVALVDYNRRLKRINGPLRNEFGAMNATLTEAVSGIEVVKGSVQERYEFDKFTFRARKYRDLFVKQGEVQAFYLPLLLFGVTLAAGFLHAMLMWWNGRLELGEVVAFMGLIGVFRFAAFVSLFSFNLVQLGIAGAGRILELLNTATALDANEAGISQPIRGAVAFKDVSFGYNGKAVIKNVSFQANPGETVAIVGQTGSGKTTLTRLINRIFDVDSGTVLVDDTDVRDWNLESLRSQVSTIEQDIFLFSRTIAENIAFGAANATRDEVEQAAREAQAHDFIISFKDGYDTEIGERGVTLSGGQRQRIAIARAFLTNPRILVLDDSTSAIDSATEDRIQQAMRRISSERTTFLITHRLSQIRWADRILLVRGGELVDQGAHDELLERSADYRRIFARYE